jgi:hypothetical protein
MRSHERSAAINVRGMHEPRCAVHRLRPAAQSGFLAANGGLSELLAQPEQDVSVAMKVEFMLDSARRRAEDVLLDQNLFSLNEGQFQAFLNLLDEPPKSTEELKKLLSIMAPPR